MWTIHGQQLMLRVHTSPLHGTGWTNVIETCPDKGQKKPSQTNYLPEQSFVIIRLLSKYICPYCNGAILRKFLLQTHRLDKYLCVFSVSCNRDTYAVDYFRINFMPNPQRFAKPGQGSLNVPSACLVWTALSRFGKYSHDEVCFLT